MFKYKIARRDDRLAVLVSEKEELSEQNECLGDWITSNLKHKDFAASNKCFSSSSSSSCCNNNCCCGKCCCDVKRKDGEGRKKEIGVDLNIVVQIMNLIINVLCFLC